MLPASSSMAYWSYPDWAWDESVSHRQPAELYSLSSIPTCSSTSLPLWSEFPPPSSLLLLIIPFPFKYWYITYVELWQFKLYWFWLAFCRLVEEYVNQMHALLHCPHRSPRLNDFHVHLKIVPHDGRRRKFSTPLASGLLLFSTASATSRRGTHHHCMSWEVSSYRIWVAHPPFLFLLLCCYSCAYSCSPNCNFSPVNKHYGWVRFGFTFSWATACFVVQLFGLQL